MSRTRRTRDRQAIPLLRQGLAGIAAVTVAAAGVAAAGFALALVVAWIF